MFIKKLFKKKLNAFSLLEISLVLLIIGFVSMFFFFFFNILNFYNKQQQTNDKVEYIQLAMQSYAVKYGYLPYAATDNSGEETLNNLEGFVPYKTLGIPKKYLYNAYKKNFKYVVNYNLTHNNMKVAPMFLPEIACSMNFNTQVYTRSFARYYVYDNENKIIKYDRSVDYQDLILLDENSKSIIDENDYFFAMCPIKGFELLIDFVYWIEGSEICKTNNLKYKINNCVAWIIISEGTKKNLDNWNNSDRIYRMNFKYNDKIFYQTKFDLATQAGYPVDGQPIYDKNDHLIKYSYNKKLLKKKDEEKEYN